MSFIELANKRYSVRSYKSDPVDDEVLKQVLDKDPFGVFHRKRFSHAQVNIVRGP